MSDDELRYESRMSDSDALMWTIEKDPLLRSTITAVSLLDGPVDAERFADKVDGPAALIPRLRQRVRRQPVLARSAPLGGRPELRPRLPPAPRQRRRRRRRARAARPGPVGRDAGLRPGPTALGDVRRRRHGRRPVGADPEGAPRHHRRRRLDPDRPHALRPRARARPTPGRCPTRPVATCSARSSGWPTAPTYVGRRRLGTLQRSVGSVTGGLARRARATRPTRRAASPTRSSSVGRLLAPATAAAQPRDGRPLPQRAVLHDRAPARRPADRGQGGRRQAERRLRRRGGRRAAALPRSSSARRSTRCA